MMSSPTFKKLMFIANGRTCYIRRSVTLTEQEHSVKLSNFLFPESREPALDERVIDETIAEAKLTEQLGFDAVWLAEHHFDGICAYVDPISFAAALATVTSRIKIGFAVAQVSLHHPIRLAEQISLLDNITKGRIIAGLGRGTAYNVYDYQGYDVPAGQAQERFEESETIMLKAWSGDPVEHNGKYWNLKLPMLRPRPYTRPHPFIIRSSGTEESMLGIARNRRPFMMNVQSNDVTRSRMELYRQTLRAQGTPETEVRRLVDDCWVWRNVFVAQTDSEAERVGVPLFQEMQRQRAAMRERVFKEQGVRLQAHAPGPTAPAAREIVEHALIHGSPATVAEKLAAIDAIGVGGLIMSFRLGPMPYELATSSLRLFAEKVMPAMRMR
jgi:alkanesulfonate monooxygenase SsuD/methylene tetrahydromethanopterin reductase-like flavin-dependent oxidoreductase (luciferase family)